MRQGGISVFIVCAAFLAGGAAGFMLGRRGSATQSEIGVARGSAGADALGDPANPGSGQAEGFEGKDVPVNVAITRVSKQPLTEHVTLPAVVEAWRDVSISSELGGKLSSVEVEEGNTVKARQEVARIDTEDLIVTAERAKVELEFAEADFDRVQRLKAEGVVSADELDRSSTALKGARAEHEAALVSLRRAIIRSSIDGIVEEVPVEAGEYVAAGDLISRIIQKDRVKILASLPERDVRYIEVGQEVMIFPEMGAEPAYGGKVAFISQTASSHTRTYRLEVAFDNSRDALRPGMIVKIRFGRRHFTETVVTPLHTIIARKDGRYAFVEEDGVAHQRRVDLGVFDRDRVQILSGLEEGDKQIVSGHRMLADGDKVRVVETIQ